MRAKRLKVYFSRFENGRGCGATRDEAFLDLEDTVRREVGAGIRISWQEVPIGGGIVL